MKCTRWLVILAVGAGVASCASQDHLSPTHGRSFKEAFERQAIRNPEESVQPVAGLDSQEATIISDKYRRSLGAKGAEAQEEQTVLFVAPPQRNSDRAMLPPPSVPKER